VGSRVVSPKVYEEGREGRGEGTGKGCGRESDKGWGNDLVRKQQWKLKQLDSHQ
jgi:hypothetical protein